MSPEEIAKKIERRWFRPGGNSTVIDLHELIAAAIREAVAEEREACALIADSERWGKERPSGNHLYDCAWSDAAKDIGESIRARSEKVSPDVVKGD